MHWNKVTSSFYRLERCGQQTNQRKPIQVLRNVEALTSFRLTFRFLRIHSRALKDIQVHLLTFGMYSFSCYAPYSVVVCKCVCMTLGNT